MAEETEGSRGPRFTPLPVLAAAETTVTRTFVPTTPRQRDTDGPNPAAPSALSVYLARGFGDVAAAPGEPHRTRVIGAATPPGPGANPRRLVRFAHLSDLQLADDESPTRLALFDGDVTSSALRPQDAYLCRMANAAVRTVNALHRRDPIAFTLLGGDNADSAQTNEVDWVLGILSGAGEIECDSGSDEEIVSGADNDGKDPFQAEGLAIPWKWVTGNHDVLVQGNLRVDDGNRELALGGTANGGTRDYAKGGEVASGDFVVRDPRRALLSRTELVARVAGHGDGHGLGDAQRASGRATYAFDVEGTPLRFVVIDTAHERGGAEGVIRQSEVDRILRPTLDEARDQGRWVILASHHATTSLGDGTGLGGELEPDALTEEQWMTFVGGYPNVIASMVGHSHRHRITPLAPAGGHASWEIMTSAIADYPHQFRVVEVYDQDNGWIMIRATCVDFSTTDDPVAAAGHARGITDFVSGWLPVDETGELDRNVELWIERP